MVHGRVRREYYQIPKSFIGPKPVQKPHPPIYMAAYAPAAMKRVAKEADGWFPVGIPLGGVAQMFEGIKGMAHEAGRDPAGMARGQAGQTGQAAEGGGRRCRGAEVQAGAAEEGDDGELGTD